MIRGLILSAITLTCFVSAALAGDTPSANSQTKEAQAKAAEAQAAQAREAQAKDAQAKDAQAKEELVKRLKAQQGAAGAAAVDKGVEDARKQFADAQKRLAEAQKTAAEAQAKLDEATKAVTAAQQQLADAQRRAAQRAAARTFAGLNISVPQTVDRANPIQRFLLLTPGGPLVVEATITIDGQPFHEPREKLVDEMLKLATDKDGKVTWTQAIANSRRFAGQVQSFANDEYRRAYLENMDVNKDGLVDRYEARRMLAQRAGGGDFLLNASFGYGFGASGGGGVAVRQPYYPTGGADLRALLDTDADGSLTAEEIAASPDRLKSRDADDNDVLDAGELGGAVGGRRSPAPARPAQAQPTHPLALMLGDVASVPDILATLMQVYGGKDGQLTDKSFRALPKLFDELDANHDGRLSANEMPGFNRLPPHVRLKIGLGDKGQGLSVEAVSADLEKPAAAAAAGVLVTLPGVKVTFAANTGTARTYDYSAYAKQLIATYDKKANGYISKEDMPAQLATQFAQWDENDDGKVYAEEITAMYQRQLAPRMTQVGASVAMQGNSLFAALDANGDGRLGLREMRLAAERIRSFDKNRDGQATPDEIPVSMNVAFGLGGAYYGYQQSARPGAQPAAGGSRAPDWFVRMDRNGDGDISQREFLGTPEQFKKLDANGDGLIDRSEAETADRPAK